MDANSKQAQSLTARLADLGLAAFAPSRRRLPENKTPRDVPAGTLSRRYSFPATLNTKHEKFYRAASALSELEEEGACAKTQYRPVATAHSIDRNHTINSVMPY